MIFNKSLSENIKKFQDFSSVLSLVAKKYPNKIFIIEKKNQISFKDFDILVNQCCNFFLSLGLKKNDVISLYLDNSKEFLVLYFASMRYGTIVNPFPSSLAIEEVLIRAKFVKAKKIFLNKNKKGNLYYSIDSSFFLKFLKNFKNEFNIKQQGKKIACLYYSSGTLGNPKIIEYSHSSIISTQYSMNKKKFSNFFSRHLCLLPMGHTSALRYSVKQCVSTASTLIISDPFWKIRDKFWDIIEKKKINFVQVVPTILNTIINTKKKKNKKKSTLRFIGCGSSHLSPKLKDNFQKKFNVKVSNLYGLSEVGATHFDDFRKNKKKKNCIGKPFSFVKVKFLNEDKKEVGVCKVGEIAIKTPGMFSSYYKNKTLYKNSFYKDFFLTGDLGYRDFEGFHYLIDRKKNIIIKGGVNIEPEEINEVLLASREVENAVTIGIPDKFYGEDVVSFIIPKKIFINLDKIKTLCNSRLGEFKSPREINIVKSFPVGPSGKVLLRFIKKDYLKQK